MYLALAVKGQAGLTFPATREQGLEFLQVLITRLQDDNASNAP